MIKRNAIKCNRCGDVIESRHRHDFVECSCGNCCVDGGTLYLKRSFNPEGPGFTELSEIVEDLDETKTKD